MADTTWVESVLYGPPVILGRQLRPLSPLHVLILHSIDSPCLLGGPVLYDELIVAVHVCSLSWDTRHDAFPDAKSMRKWGRKQRRANIESATEAMLAYIRESWHVPERWDSGGDKEQARANGAFHLAVFGMSQLGMGEQQAWDCPLARLMCYREAYAEQQTGKSELMSEEEKRGRGILKQEQEQDQEQGPKEDENAS